MRRLTWFNEGGRMKAPRAEPRVVAASALLRTTSPAAPPLAPCARIHNAIVADGMLSHATKYQDVLINERAHASISTNFFQQNSTSPPNEHADNAYATMMHDGASLLQSKPHLLKVGPILSLLTEASPQMMNNNRITGSTTCEESSPLGRPVPRPPCAVSDTAVAIPGKEAEVACAIRIKHLQPFEDTRAVTHEPIADMLLLLGTFAVVALLNAWHSDRPAASNAPTDEIAHAGTLASPRVILSGAADELLQHSSSGWAVEAAVDMHSPAAFATAAAIARIGRHVHSGALMHRATLCKMMRSVADEMRRMRPNVARAMRAVMRFAHRAAFTATAHNSSGTWHPSHG